MYLQADNKKKVTQLVFVESINNFDFFRSLIFGWDQVGGICSLYDN